MKTLITVTIFLSIIFCNSYAQSGFEDSEGKSSVILENGGTGRINFTDANAKIGYLYSNSKTRFKFGIEITGKAENGASSLFENKDIAPNINGKLSVGYQHILSTKPHGEIIKSLIVDDWFFIQIGYNKAQYKLFDPLNGVENQIIKQLFNGYSVTGYYNILFQNNFFLGISSGFAKLNNFQSLNEIEITDRTFIVNEPGFQRYTDKKQKVRKGIFETSNHILFNYDMLWLPDFLGDRIGLDIFGRYDKDENSSQFIPGIGFFISEQGKPTKVIGGLSISYKDKDLKIGLITGFNF